MMTQNYTNYSDSHDNAGLSRRDFLRLGTVVAGGAAIAGCSPFTLMPEKQLPGYTRFVKETLESLSKGAAKIQVPNVPWTAHELTLGAANTNALRWLSAATQAAAKVSAGRDLMLTNVLYSIHGNRRELAAALKLEGAAKEAFVADYLASLSSAERATLSDTLAARNNLLSLLSEYEAHRAALADMRAVARAKTRGDLQPLVETLFEAHSAHTATVQAGLRAQIWMGVSEARYAQDSGSMLSRDIVLDSALQQSLGRYGFLEIGAQAVKSVSVKGRDGKPVKLETLMETQLQEVRKYFAAQDHNFEHHVIVDGRSPVARNVLALYPEKLSLDQAQGVLHVLDTNINAMAIGPAEGRGIVKTVMDYLPGLMLLRRIDDISLLGTPTSPTGTVEDVLNSTSKAYLGHPSVRAGNEEPTTRVIVALGITALEAGLIYFGATSGNNARHGAASPQGIGGRQNTWNGVGPK